MLIVENDGGEILSTNFWQMEQAQKGAFFLSINSGAFRLLVPQAHEEAIEEFKTAGDVIISRGPWPEKGLRDAIEILFDDGSNNPYSIHLGSNQLDRLPPGSEDGREFTFSAWTMRDEKPFKSYESKCLFRMVKYLPYLKGR